MNFNRRFILALGTIGILSTSVKGQSTMNNIIITGDMGEVGTAIKEYFDSSNIAYTGIDVKRNKNEDLLGYNYSSLIGQGSIVIHLAIKKGWDERTSEYDHDLNTSILRTCIEKKASSLIFTSSQMVNSKTLDLGPLTYYAAEKLSMEAKLRASAEQGLLTSRVLRLGSFAPNNPEPKGDWTRANKVTLNHWIAKAIDAKIFDAFAIWDVIGQTK